MNYILIIGLFQTFGNCYGLYNKQSKIVESHVETYWESWVEEHCPDFACNLADIPITPIGTKHGVNIVNLAFGKPGKSGCSEAQGEPCVLLPGYQGNETLLREGIDTIHSKGGLVKIAIGGATYGNPTPNHYLPRLVNTIEEYGLDGVDFTEVTWTTSDQAGVAAMIKELREMMPRGIISLTLPSRGCWDDCWGTLTRGSEPYVDYFNIYDATPDSIQIFESYIPRSKLVWGIEIARDCLMEATFTAATTVRRDRYSGVMTWAINTDTDQRGDYENEECNGFQTGHPDGSYVDIISYILNHNDVID